MPEPIQQPSIEEMTAELETLRRVNAEPKAKSSARKAKVAELEATVTELQGKYTASQDSLRQHIVEAPLKAMADSISTAPELWLQEFGKTYRVEQVNGKLTLQTADGKAVLKDDGQAPVPFERQALVELLTNDSHSASKSFKAITVFSRASGGASTHRTERSSRPDAKKHAMPQFGLR